MVAHSTPSLGVKFSDYQAITVSYYSYTPGSAGFSSYLNSQQQAVANQVINDWNNALSGTRIALVLVPGAAQITIGNGNLGANYLDVTRPDASGINDYGVVVRITDPVDRPFNIYNPQLSYGSIAVYNVIARGIYSALGGGTDPYDQGTAGDYLRTGNAQLSERAINNIRSIYSGGVGSGYSGGLGSGASVDNQLQLLTQASASFGVPDLGATSTAVDAGNAANQNVQLAAPVLLQHAA
jgi:hypothetical protein